jgi:hypothetical protein
MLILERFLVKIPPIASFVLRVSLLAIIRMVIKKCEAMRLAVIYGSQPTNRKQGGLPLRASLPPDAFLLVGWESYMTPSWPEYSKIPPQTGGSFYFLIKKSPKTKIF